MKLYILLNIDNSIKKLTIHSKSFEVTLSHFYKETIVQRLRAGLPYVIYTLICSWPLYLLNLVLTSKKHMHFQQLMATRWMSFMLLMIISFPAISRVPSSYKESYFRNFTKLRYSFPPILSLSKQITHWNLIFVDKNKIAFSLLGETLFYFSESS